MKKKRCEEKNNKINDLKLIINEWKKGKYNKRLYRKPNMGNERLKNNLENYEGVKEEKAHHGV